MATRQRWVLGLLPSCNVEIAPKPTVEHLRNSAKRETTGSSGCLAKRPVYSLLSQCDHGGVEAVACCPEPLRTVSVVFVGNGAR